MINTYELAQSMGQQGLVGWELAQTPGGITLTRGNICLPVGLPDPARVHLPPENWISRAGQICIAWPEDVLAQQIKEVMARRATSLSWASQGANTEDVTLRLGEEITRRFSSRIQEVSLQLDPCDMLDRSRTFRVGFDWSLRISRPWEVHPAMQQHIRRMSALRQVVHGLLAQGTYVCPTVSNGQAGLLVENHTQGGWFAPDFCVKGGFVSHLQPERIPAVCGLRPLRPAHPVKESNLYRVSDGPVLDWSEEPMDLPWAKFLLARPNGDLPTFTLGPAKGTQSDMWWVRQSFAESCPLRATRRFSLPGTGREGLLVQEGDVLDPQEHAVLWVEGWKDDGTGSGPALPPELLMKIGREDLASRVVHRLDQEASQKAQADWEFEWEYVDLLSWSGQEQAADHLAQDLEARLAPLETLPSHLLGVDGAGRAVYANIPGPGQVVEITVTHHLLRGSWVPSTTVTVEFLVPLESGQKIVTPWGGKGTLLVLPDKVMDMHVGTGIDFLVPSQSQKGGRLWGLWTGGIAAEMAHQGHPGPWPADAEWAHVEWETGFWGIDTQITLPSGKRVPGGRLLAVAAEQYAARQASWGKGKFTADTSLITCRTKAKEEAPGLLEHIFLSNTRGQRVLERTLRFCV